MPLPLLIATVFPASSQMGKLMELEAFTVTRFVAGQAQVNPPTVKELPPMEKFKLSMVIYTDPA